VPDPIYADSFMADDKLMIMSKDGGRIIKFGSTPVRIDIAYNKKRNILAIADKLSIKLIDVKNAKLIKQIYWYGDKKTLPEMNMIGNVMEISSIDISDDGKYLTASSIKFGAKIWDIDKGKEIKYIENLAYDVDFNSDGNKILTSGFRTVNILDLLNNKQIELKTKISLWVNFIKISPDNNHILVQGLTDIYQLYSLDKISKENKNGFVKSFKDIKSGLFDTKATTAEFSSDGKQLLIGGQDKLHLYDVKSMKLIKEFDNSYGDIHSVAFNDNNTHILIGTYDGTVAQIDVETKKPLYVYKNIHQTNINYISYMKNNRYFITSSEDGMVKFWDSQTQKEILKLLSYEEGEIFLTSDNHFKTSSKDVAKNVINISNGTSIVSDKNIYKRYENSELIERIANKFNFLKLRI